MPTLCHKLVLFLLLSLSLTMKVKLVSMMKSFIVIDAVFCQKVLLSFIFKFS